LGVTHNTLVHIAILTFEGFNELDSLVALGVLNRIRKQPAFHAQGNVATAGGCFASQYLAAWIIARTEGEEAAKSALHYVAPVGEKEEYVARALKNIVPYLGDSGAFNAIVGEH